MTTRIRVDCDGCQVPIAPGAQPDGTHIRMVVYSAAPEPEQPPEPDTLDFCGWSCLASFATARALIDDVTGEGGQS